MYRDSDKEIGSLKRPDLKWPFWARIGRSTVSRAREIGSLKGPDLLLVVSLLAGGMPALSHAQEVRWQVGSTPSFSSGRYGTDSATAVFYTPVTVRRLFRDGDVAFVVPFTCVRGNGTVTVGTGTPGRTQTTTEQVTTECGLGDMVGRGRYYVVDEHGAVPTIALVGHLKIPTASAARGLGTGKPDEGLGLELSRSVGSGVLAMVDLGYTVIGKPADDDLNNTWWYDIGLSKRIANGRATVSVFFEEYSALVPGLANARDILGVISLIRPGGWRIQLVGQAGLSDGAPDHGFTLGASRRF